MNWTFVLSVLLVGCGPSDEVIDRDEDGSPNWNDTSPDDNIQQQAEFDLIATWTDVDLTFDIYGDLTGNYFYCHPTNDNGVSLAYGGAYDAINEGADTVFTDSSFDGTVTYYVEQGDACYVWGNDVSYYAGLGCTEW